MMPLQQQQQQQPEQVHPPTFNWQLEDYAFFRKCGEITASPDVQCFGFNCAFCPAICLQFTVFMDHIREHLQEVQQRYEEGGADEKIEQTTQTDLMIMEMDGSGVISGSRPYSCPDIYTDLDHQATITTPTNKYTSTAKVLDTQSMGVGLQLVNISQTTPTNHSPVQQQGTPLAAGIDLLYVMSNPLPLPLPPSPPLSSDGQQQQQQSPSPSPSCSLPPLAPFEVLQAGIGVTPTLSHDLAEAMTPTPLPRYETRRVAMQRKQQQQEEQQQLEHEKQQNAQHSVENVLQLTPPATPPTTNQTNTPTRNLKSSSRRDLERNREFVSCLLVAYERLEKLWNPKHPDYKYNAKRSVYSELAAPLENAFNLQLTGTEIFAVLKELRGRYRRELSKLNSLGGKYKSRLWYFGQMHFLRTIIENKRAEKEAKNLIDIVESENACETDTESLTKSSTFREVLSYILDAFKRQECLWNPQHYDYASCCKQELYCEISSQLHEDLNYEMSGDECYKEIQKLRTRYRKELRMVIKHKGLYLPKLWCFDEMEFLHHILQEQIFNKISKKVGVVETNQRTKFFNANAIEFATAEDQLQFADIYRNYPALWDVDHPDFRSNAYRSQALGQMLDELNTTLNVPNCYTAEQLEKTLFEMRKQFSAQKRKILTQPPNACSSISLLHAKLSQFLEQNLGPFRCDVCLELIKTCDQFKVHRSGHDNTQPFICTLCGKGFQMPCNLTVHIRRHRRDFPYACERCDKRFATSTEVAIHMRSHTGERPYICDLCGKSFKTWSFFDIHRRRHLNQSTFHCPICPKGFYEKNRFTDHMNSHWAIRKHLCTVCGKTFTTYGNLKKHTELHLAVKKYKCNECGKRFAQFASLRWHKKRAHAHEEEEEEDEEDKST
ncbi:uncharacterized protein Dwil_GK19707 [Drosophila willistoni]|uniref:Uncharacterized protein n=1 Tax=Drosophila willistoni TaxID=7260 RepID=B4MP72_DROWI|nr:uncharacterized protein LOC6639730 [Drosophila willistoni]EDW73911.1 uncharacterized protein Dwil_GK19707 [Drosophila willistoni]